MIPDQLSAELEQKFPKRELTLRLASAAVLLPFGVFVVYFGGWLYAITLLGLCGILAWEYVKLWQPQNYYKEFALYMSGLLAVLAGFYLDLSQFHWIFVACAIVILGINRKTPFLMLGLLIFAIFFHFGLEFRDSAANGMAICVMLCATAWGGDTGAYIAGRLFGGEKLAPTISPKKTWSGFWGALVGGAFFTSLMCVFLSVPITYLVIIWAIFCALFGVMGDLLESWLKRIARVKDTSDLIPGHGGLLDRFDGLISVVLLNGFVIMVMRDSADFSTTLLGLLK